MLGEPRVLDRRVVLVKKVDSHEGGRLPERPDELQKVGAGHVDGHKDIELDSIGLRRPGFQVTDGALVVVYGLQDASQGAHSVAHAQEQSGVLSGLVSLGRLGDGILQQDFLFSQASVCTIKL